MISPTGYQVNKYCNQEISLPFREGNSSRSEGLIHNPGYPHFYLSHEPYCKWKIKALPFQKIKLTILDLAVISKEHFSLFFIIYNSFYSL